jgi:dihydroorotate dehydrogenase electron transfer subunit
MNPGHRSIHYPDRAWHGPVIIQRNDCVGRDTYALGLSCPPIAGRAFPGQFIMIRLAGSADPLLARPMAIYEAGWGTDGRPAGLEVVYLAVGKMTRRLARLSAGEPLEVWGPLGNGFAPLPTEHLILVAGGIGQTPFLSLAQEYLGRRRYGDPPRSVPRASRVTLCYGARSGEFLVGVDDFRSAGVEVCLSTDDGTVGRKGPVTELVPDVVARNASSCRIVCCGPEAMMAATARLARQLGVPCQVSLETPMACGIGICFSCVTKVRDGQGGWDYRRTCVEGPVFDADQIEL